MKVVDVAAETADSTDFGQLIAAAANVDDEAIDEMPARVPRAAAFVNADYQNLWPILNAAAASRHPSQRRLPSHVTKRASWATAPVVEERLARFSRNLPADSPLYQISTVGDLPMFRFGK